MQSVKDFLINNVHIVTPSCVLIVMIYCAVMLSVPNMKVRMVMYKIFSYTICVILACMVLILFMWIILKKGF